MHPSEQTFAGKDECNQGNRQVSKGYQNNGKCNDESIQKAKIRQKNQFCEAFSKKGKNEATKFKLVAYGIFI